MTRAAHTRYDAKCLEWDQFICFGEGPTGAAIRIPGEWQLVYELRPLELIPYWLGIPFRPHHPVYAVIYDADCPAYYTAPAYKIRSLGRPRWVRSEIPLVRLFDLSHDVDRRLRALADAIGEALAGAVRAAVRIGDSAVNALATLSSGQS